MPIKVLQKQTGHTRFDWPFTGKLRIDVDPALIGETNFRSLINMRYTPDGIKGIQGMTPINISQIGYTNLVNGFHYRKDNPAKNHLFVQGVSGSNSILYKSDNAAAIPNQDTFSAYQTLENNNTVRFSEAPNSGMCAMNGSVNRIWEGLEARVGSFIVYDPNGSFWYDYTDQVNNTLSDAANIASMPQTGGGIDSSCKAMWHFDGVLGDDSGNNHTLTGVNSPTYTTGEFLQELALATNQYAYVAAHADFNFSGNTYTVDGWFNVTSLAAINPIYYQNTTADADSFSIYTDTNGAVNVKVRKTGQSDFLATTANGVVAAATTFHLAVVQKSTILYIFVNGYLAWQGTAPLYIQSYTGNVQLGYNNTVYFNGWMDEVRVSNIARWTVPFSVPIAPYSSVTALVNIYIGSNRPIQGVKFYMGTANGSAASAAAYEWTGAVWLALAVADYTAVGGATLAQTGEISFPSTVSTAKLKAIKGSVAYYYRFVFTGVDAGTTIYHCTLDAPMQAVTDLWDGSGGSCLDCYQYTTSYTDYTPNVAQSTSSNPKAYGASDPTTYAQFGSLPSGGIIYCGFINRVMGLQINMPDASYVNTVANTIAYIQYWTGVAWVGVGALDDSTSTGGISFNHSGTITWNPPSLNTEFQTSVADTYQFYYYRIQFTQILSSDVRVDTITGIAAQVPVLPYRFSVMWQNRLWLFNNQADKKNSGICSAYGTNCVFNGTDSVEREFGNKELMCGDSIYSRYGSNLYDNMIVCGRDSTYLVDGGGPDTWTIYTVSDKKGCVAPLTFKKCDISFEVAQGITKHVLIWRATGSVEFFDGNTIATISDDIQSFFDPASPDFIDPAVYDVSQEAGAFDEINFEYHWFFTNAAGQLEGVFNLKRKKWSFFSRGTGKALTCGWIAEDTRGQKYVYAGTSGGYIERLENGTTFDGNAIIYTVWMGDNLLLKSQEYVTKIRHLKLLAKAKNISSATVALTWYPDTALVGTSLTAASQKSSTNRLYQAKWSGGWDAVFHGFMLTVTTSTELIGFEPLLFSGLYEATREDVI